MNVFDSNPPNWTNLLKGQLQSPNVDNKSSQDALFASASSVPYKTFVKEVESSSM